MTRSATEKEDRASNDVLVVEPVSAHEISEALEPARGVQPVSDGVLIVERALEGGTMASHKSGSRPSQARDTSTDTHLMGPAQWRAVLL